MTEPRKNREIVAGTFRIGGLGKAVAQATPTGKPPHVEILDAVRRQVARSNRSWKNR